MAGDCRNAPDLGLLIHVSKLSGRLRHYAGQNRRDPMVLGLRLTVLLAAIAAAGLCSGGAHADVRDHDAVRRAVEQGEIRSLSDILALVRDKLPGAVTGVKIEQKSGHWLYEFRVIDRKGSLFEVYVDARTAQIERIKEK
jgi:uncharacterized membrane protein YkoI